MSELGASGLISQPRGQLSNRRIPARQREHFVGLVRAHYADFGPELARETWRKNTALLTASSPFANG